MSDSLVLKSQRFRREREADWKRLETLLKSMERAGVHRLTPDEMIELPILYRSVLSSLSVARATSLDRNVVDYLESLSARAYYILYGTQVPLRQRIAGFFARDWSAAVKRIGPETLISAFCMVLGALIAYALVTHDPEWYFSFVPSGLAGERSPTASTEALRKTLYYSGDSDGLSSFATSLFSHNSRVSIFAFALGFMFGLPTVLLILYNGCTLGAFVALFAGRGLGFEVGGWLIIHGATEIFAIVLAGAAGLHIGRATAFPGQLSRLDAATEAGKTAGLVMAGVVIMLFFAGLLEGFGRQLITHDLLRYAIGIGTFSLWCLYFYAARRPADAEESVYLYD